MKFVKTVHFYIRIILTFISKSESKRFPLSIRGNMEALLLVRSAQIQGQIRM